MSVIDLNPKAKFGDEKVPLHLFPPVAMELIALVMKNGAEKYGPYNWRLTKVKSSTYYAAMLRHLTAYFEGQDIDPESGKPHLAHVAASVCILLDADSKGCLIDDRPPQPIDMEVGELTQAMREKSANVLFDQIKRLKT